MSLKISQFPEANRPELGDYVPVVRDGVNYKAPLPTMTQYYDKDVQLYVTKSGDDTTGDGTVDKPFLSIQKAINHALRNFYVHQGCYVYINVGAGTYTNTVWLSQRVTGGGDIWIRGNEATPSSVVLQPVTGSCITVYEGTIHVSGVTLQATDGSCLSSQYTGSIRTWAGIVFGTTTNGWHMIAGYGGTIVNHVNFTVSGGSRGLWHAHMVGCINASGITVTLTGTPYFTYQTAAAYCGATLALWGMTFVGAATGQRYLVYVNGSIWTAGLTLPGNAAGSTSTGGTYG